MPQDKMLRYVQLRAELTQSYKQYKTKEAEMTLIQLEIQLNIIITNINTKPYHHPDDPLVYIFSAEDLQKLENKPITDPDRSDFVLALLASYLTVPGHIKELIQLLYQRITERSKSDSEASA